MSRSTETVRLTLRAYDRVHPDRAIFPAAAPSLDEMPSPRSTAGSAWVSRPRSGAAVRRTRSSIYRLINEVWAELILAPSSS